MTVGELIIELQKYRSDMEITALYDYNSSVGDVAKVEEKDGQVVFVIE